VLQVRATGETNMGPDDINTFNTQRIQGR